MYYVYLLASARNGTLYLGVTNDLIRRVYEHKAKALPGFTARYGLERLVWFEVHDDVEAAILREKRHQEMAARLENPTDRGIQSRLARFVRFARGVALLPLCV